ncbi:hypothetical protein [Streptococcus sobrinus]|uniref:hypothetical protein n=1 Tax=Streptococcus sobrinus TaxID=1310 RepID=UPI00037884CB|nr:hypothetical protein [Streptococcus sobrinus]
MTKKQSQIKEAIIRDLTKQTGWSRKRVVVALQELEDNKLLQFTSEGNLRVYGG